MDILKNPILSEIERVKQEIELHKKTAKQFEDIQNKKSLAQQKYETLKHELRQNELALTSKLEDMKNKITESDFERERIDQEFQNVVQNLKTNKIVYEDIAEAYVRNQKEFIDKTCRFTEEEDRLKEVQGQLAKVEREIQKENEERSSQKSAIVTLESELKAGLRQKKVLEESIQKMDVQHTSALSDTVAFEKEISSIEAEICTVTYQLKAIESDKEKIVKYTTEVETDLSICQNNVSKMKDSIHDIEDKIKSEETLTQKLQSALKALLLEKTRQEEELNKSENDLSAIENNLNKKASDISYANIKLEDEKKDLSHLIAIAEKENANLESILDMHKRIAEVLERNQKESRGLQLKERLNAIIEL